MFWNPRKGRLRHWEKGSRGGNARDWQEEFHHTRRDFTRNKRSRIHALTWSDACQGRMLKMIGVLSCLGELGGNLASYRFPLKECIHTDSICGSLLGYPPWRRGIPKAVENGQRCVDCPVQSEDDTPHELGSTTTGNRGKDRAEGS